jgi:hypothetical protein
LLDVSGAFNFGAVFAQAPVDLRGVSVDVEALPFERREPFRSAFLASLLEQASDLS